MKTSSLGVALVALVSLAVIARPAVPAGDEDGGPRLERSLDVDGVSSSSLGLELGDPAWTADGGQENAQLGASLASAGDVNGDGYSDVIVGAPQYANGESGEGRALVYHGSADGLSSTPAWTAEGNQADALFGSSVATAGDVNGDGYSDVIVGAYQYDNGQLDEGRAFVYLGSASGLASSAAWTAESNQVEARFGGAVASAGDVDGDGYSDVIVGAWAYDNGQATEGRVFVYSGSASGLATSASWTAEGDQAGAFFGAAVAGVGDVDGDGYGDVVVGASGYQDLPAQANEGAAFLFLGSASGLESSTWAPQANQAAANFGIAVASAGDVNGDGFADVIVGANAYETGETDEGQAFVYLGSASGLAAGPAWQGDSDQASANYGIAVASAGDLNGDGFGDVIVGARSFDNGEANEGRAYIYLGRAGGLTPSAETTVESDQADASFGQSVALAGDVNGDGYTELLVGSHLFDEGETDQGRAFLFAGTAKGLSDYYVWSLTFPFKNIASAGDVNGDGYNDVIAGLGSTSRVYLSSASGYGVSASWVVDGDGASAGDVNGDGYDDVIVGQYLYDGGETNEGRALLYLGSANGLSTSPAWFVEGNQAEARFGFSPASAGDVNGDGYGDVMFDSSLGTFVFHGSAGVLSSSAAWNVAYGLGTTGDVAGDVNGDGYGDVIVSGRLYLGSAQGLLDDEVWLTAEAEIAGDVNGDGFADVISPSYSPGAEIYPGSPLGPGATPWVIQISPQPQPPFEIRVDSAGDVNGDGFGDVAIVCTLIPGLGGDPHETFVFVHLGSASGPAVDPDWFVFNDNMAGQFSSCASTGDVNGDGFGDVAISWRTFNSFQGGWGYLGNEGSGWTRAPQQRTSDASRPIALHGRSDERRFFDIRLRFEERLAGYRWASSLAPTARLEWEVAPLGVTLDGSAIESGAPQAITGAPLVFDEIVRLGPSATNKPFHWRARIRTNNPLFPVTPWTWLHGNGVSEAKLRRGVMEPPSPGVPVPVAAGRPKKP